jgi:hypothetical protein
VLRLLLAGGEFHQMPSSPSGRVARGPKVGYGNDSSTECRA